MEDRKISYAKLKNGEWGIRGYNLTSGEVVVVRRKDGQEHQRIIGRILWHGDGGFKLAECETEPICHHCGQRLIGKE